MRSPEILYIAGITPIGFYCRTYQQRIMISPHNQIRIAGDLYDAVTQETNRPVRDLLSLKQYSVHTVKIYVNWVRFFILFHNTRYPLIWWLL